MNRTKVEYQELRKALKKYDEKVMDKYDDLSINFKGCMTEELCYNDIKSYFNERKETGNDISLGSVTGCCRWLFGNLRQHTELHYVG